MKRRKFLQMIGLAPTLPYLPNIEAKPIVDEIPVLNYGKRGIVRVQVNKERYDLYESHQEWDFIKNQIVDSEFIIKDCINSVGTTKFSCTVVPVYELSTIKVVTESGIIRKFKVKLLSNGTFEDIIIGFNISKDFKVKNNKDIRYIGKTNAKYTVLELHRWLQNEADKAIGSILDITSLNPSIKHNNNYIELLNGYNIDKYTFSKLTNGTISQRGIKYNEYI